VDGASTTGKVLQPRKNTKKGTVQKRKNKSMAAASGSLTGGKKGALEGVKKAQTKKGLGACCLGACQKERDFEGAKQNGGVGWPWCRWRVTKGKKTQMGKRVIHRVSKKLGKERKE